MVGKYIQWIPVNALPGDTTNNLMYIHVLNGKVSGTFVIL